MNILHDTLKEVTEQMHNEGNGEYTIPAWFARSLYDVLKEHEAKTDKTCYHCRFYKWDGRLYSKPYCSCPANRLEDLESPTVYAYTEACKFRKV